MLFALQLLFADQASDPSAPAPSNSLVTTILTFLPIILLGYWLLFRPMKRQEKERKNLLSTLKKNDKVETSGGLLGIVASINEKEDEVTLKVDENSNVRVRVTKRSIVRIRSAEEPSKEQKEGSA